jgi:hypothetical protein
MPRGLPDLIGLAIKLPPRSFAATPWDILLVSAGSGLLTRFALRPVTSWRASMTSLMPLRYSGRYWWVRARMTTEIPGSGLSLERISEQLAHGSIEYSLEQACGSGAFEPLARLELKEATATDVAFDPTIHSDPDVQLAPGWLTNIRGRAYNRSRRGRPSD